MAHPTGFDAKAAANPVVAAVSAPARPNPVSAPTSASPAPTPDKASAVVLIPPNFGNAVEFAVNLCSSIIPISFLFSFRVFDIS